MSEIARLFSIDRKTCHRWIKNEGLRVIERGVNPLLVMGTDLISFLKEKRAARKRVLGEGEFFCFKCHKSVKAKAGSESTIKTGKTIGKANLEQVKKIGACEVCQTRVNRFLKVSQRD